MSDNTTAHAIDDDSAGGGAAPPRSTSPEVPQQEVDKSTKTDPPNLSDNQNKKKETLPQTTAERPSEDTSAHGIRSLVFPDQENHNSKKDSVPSSVPPRLNISNMASDLDDGLPISSGNLQMSMALKVEMEKTQASPTMKVSNRASCHIFLRR